MLNASEKKAKLVGLLVDRREIGNAGEFEQMTDISQILEKVRAGSRIRSCGSPRKSIWIGCQSKWGTA